MEKRMVRMRMSQPGRGMPVMATNPSRAVATPKPMYEPTMKTSPWAKLNSIRMLYTME
jgi:hypothetical protein